MGGSTSAPVKKLSAVERQTSASSSSAAIWKHLNIHDMACIIQNKHACTFTTVEKISEQHECTLFSNSGICAFSQKMNSLEEVPDESYNYYV